MIYRVSSAHEEGGERVYAVSTEAFVGDPVARGAAGDGTGEAGAGRAGAGRAGAGRAGVGAGGSAAASRARLRALRLVDVELSDGRFQPVEGSAREIACELALLAMGFTGPERSPLLADLGVALDERGNVARDESYATSVPGVFAAGDMGRGQSLIVWAIAEGRGAAAAVDAHLSGSTELPMPITPVARPLR
jgi:glutamate synthase (NADPH/NADH) small chain